VEAQSDALRELETATEIAISELGKQHDIMQELSGSELRVSVLKLLSSSLRTSQGLQWERNSLRRWVQAAAV
jgi:hypothetical protein